MPAVKRDPSPTDSALSTALQSTPKKARKTGSGPSTPRKGASAKMVKNEDGSPGKKMGSWSKEELQLLYAIMCPKRTGVKWEEVAAQIDGRDAKACNNKWSRMQGKIMEAIGGMGE